jgi:predicted ribosome quality control (RQC) complex YloA/Tae2 family protein
MFKVGNVVKIILINGNLTDDNFEIISCIEHNFFKYQIRKIKSGTIYEHSGSGFVFDKKYYRKEKISKLIDIL